VFDYVNSMSQTRLCSTGQEGGEILGVDEYIIVSSSQNKTKLFASGCSPELY
jgi:hypothetical protein